MVHRVGLSTASLYQGGARSKTPAWGLGTGDGVPAHVLTAVGKGRDLGLRGPGAQAVPICV